jgi:hypothetical protein
MLRWTHGVPSNRLGGDRDRETIAERLSGHLAKVAFPRSTTERAVRCLKLEKCGSRGAISATAPPFRRSGQRVHDVCVSCWRNGSTLQCIGSA